MKWGKKDTEKKKKWTHKINWECENNFINRPNFKTHTIPPFHSLPRTISPLLHTPSHHITPASHASPCCFTLHHTICFRLCFTLHYTISPHTSYASPCLLFHTLFHRIIYIIASTANHITHDSQCLLFHTLPHTISSLLLIACYFTHSPTPYHPCFSLLAISHTPHTISSLLLIACYFTHSPTPYHPCFTLLAISHHPPKHYSCPIFTLPEQLVYSISSEDLSRIWPFSNSCFCIGCLALVMAVYFCFYVSNSQSLIVLVCHECNMLCVFVMGERVRRYEHN